MSHPPKPERDDKAAEDVVAELSPMDRFRTLAERLLSVSREQLAEQETKPGLRISTPDS